MIGGCPTLERTAKLFQLLEQLVLELATLIMVYLVWEPVSQNKVIEQSVGCGFTSLVTGRITHSKPCEVVY